MSRSPTLRIAASLFACAFVTRIQLRAAEPSVGTINGTVIDASTGKYLEGADVSLDAGANHTTTARDGSYDLNNVAAGPHRLTIAYPGFEPHAVDVSVESGRVANVPVRLGATSEIVKLAEFHVAGTKEGMAQAIALQRAAPNMKVVAASDQYGDISEGNAAEYLKFLPGIGIDYNANDARAVTLRGMSTQFTNVLMDGTPIASATSGNLNRRFEFEQVAINNVETIEVTKTLTPDIMATSTGGNINLVSNSAFDHEGNLLTYRAYFQAINTDLYLKKTEGWGQEKTRKILPGLDLTYAFRVGTKLGIALAYKNSQLFNNYPRSSYSWDYSTANGASPANPVLTSWNLQNEQKDTRRQALSSRFDYKLSDATKLSLLTDWNFYDLLFTDRTITVNTGSTPSRGANGTVVGRLGAGSVTFQTINRWKSGVTWDFPLNFTHRFDNDSVLNASVYWSQAYSKYRDTTGSWYSDATISRGNSTTDKLQVTFSDVGAVVPQYVVTDATGAPVDLTDVSKFSVTQIRSRPQTGVDTRDGYSADYKYDFKFRIPTSLTLGGRDDYTTRDIFDPVFVRNNPPITGAQVVGLADTGFSQHPIGFGLPAYNFVSVYRAYTQLGGLNYLTYTPGGNGEINARFVDHTPAGFARLDFTPLDNLLVIGGVRYEDRETTSKNRIATALAPNGVTTVFTDKSWFPSLNLKYDVTRKLVLRAGYSKTIGLPDYSDLLPALTIVQPTSTAAGTVNVYNPNLKSYRVDNYDAGFEYYYSSTGFVAASVFRKDLTNFIATVSQQLTPDLVTQLGVPTSALNSPLNQYNATYRLNVPETGSYNGLELQASQNLTFLPKPFNTLSVQANATFLGITPMDSHQVFNSADPGVNAAIHDQIQKNLELSSVKRSINFELNYTYGNWGFNLVSNYTGYVLKTISQKTVTPAVTSSGVVTTPGVYFNELQSQAPRELVDVRIDYKWNRRFTPYFQVRNIFGRPIVMSTQTMPFNHAEYGDPIYELGVRGVW